MVLANSSRRESEAKTASNRNEDTSSRSPDCTSASEDNLPSSAPSTSVEGTLRQWGIRSFFPSKRRALAEKLVNAGLTAADVQLICEEVEASASNANAAALIGSVFGQEQSDLPLVLKEAHAERGRRLAKEKGAAEVDRFGKKVHDAGAAIREENNRRLQESRELDLDHLRRKCYGLARDGRSIEVIAAMTGLHEEAVQVLLSDE